MKTIAIILVAFSLSGCFYQSVNQYDLQAAIKACGAMENIAHISAGFGGRERVTCYDSKKIFLHEGK